MDAARKTVPGGGHTAAQQLAEFSCGLRYEDIPSDVAERAKDILIDTYAACLFGSRMPWSRMVSDYARACGAGGPCALIGDAVSRVHAPVAALANGVFAHAFEMDGARNPSVGSHPGAALLPTVLSVGEEVGASGKEVIAAFVAGNEVLIRVASASHHSEIEPERLGFHAPASGHVYGTAVAAGKLLGLNLEQMTNAMGVAGSFSCGILAFKSAASGMVKRLHLGRAAEGGVTAAKLAQRGYEGPETILEGRYGFLDSYSRGGDPSYLTKDLHKDWETLRIGMKRYACIIVGQLPIYIMQLLMQEHGFAGDDVAEITVAGLPRIITHNNIVEPADVMQAQYSVQFCTALPLYKDPLDPNNFSMESIADPRIRAACRLVKLEELPGGKGAIRMSVVLKDGRQLEKQLDTFKGMASDPLSRDELYRKIELCAGDSVKADKLFGHLAALENESRVSLAAWER